MASDSKNTKPEAAPKKAEPAPKSDVAPKSDAAAKVETPAAKDAPKAEGSEAAAAAPSSYSRGEGQKPVTAAYKENWNAIFAKKAKKNAKKKSR